MISAWRGFRQHKESYNADEVLACSNINEWIKWLYADTRRLHWHLHTQTQMSFVDPVKNVFLIPYVEGQNIQENPRFRECCARIMGKAPADVVRRNTNVDAGEILTSNSIAIIEDLYQVDIGLYEQAKKQGNGPQ
jgi:hypothetical protein